MYILLKQNPDITNKYSIGESAHPSESNPVVAKRDKPCSKSRAIELTPSQGVDIGLILSPTSTNHGLNTNKQHTIAVGANAEAQATRRARIADFIMVYSAVKVGFLCSIAQMLIDNNSRGIKQSSLPAGDV